MRARILGALGVGDLTMKPATIRNKADKEGNGNPTEYWGGVFFLAIKKPIILFFSHLSYVSHIMVDSHGYYHYLASTHSYVLYNNKTSKVFDNVPLHLKAE
jgi:hypothetical protein